MVKFHGFSKRKAVHKSIKPTLAIDFIEQPSHPVSFINQLPYAVLDKNVLWLSISEQDINFPTSLTNELRLFSDYVKVWLYFEFIIGIMSIKLPNPTVTTTGTLYHTAVPAVG